MFSSTLLFYETTYEIICNFRLLLLRGLRYDFCSFQATRMLLQTEPLQLEPQKCNRQERSFLRYDFIDNSFFATISLTILSLLRFHWQFFLRYNFIDNSFFATISLTILSSLQFRWQFFLRYDFVDNSVLLFVLQMKYCCCCCWLC
jgi:hypothetical protein